MTQVPWRQVNKDDALEISHRAWDDLMKTQDEAKRREIERLVRTLNVHRQATIVEVQNNSSEEFDTRFRVVGISGPGIGPDDNLRQFKNRVYLSGVKPQEKEHLGQFAVFLEPATSGAIRRAYVSGVFPVQIEVLDEDDEFADVKHDTVEHLQTRCCGAAQILWKESGTGVKWAIVRLGVPNWLKIANYCVLMTQFTAAATVDHVCRLIFDKRASFRIFHEKVDPTEEPQLGLVSIGGGPHQSGMFQISSDPLMPPQWTQSGVLGRSLHLSPGGGQAWLGLGDNTYVLNAVGGETQHIKLPSKKPDGCNAHLYVNKFRDDCVETEWGYPGVTGGFYTGPTTSDPEERYITVHRGIVTSITPGPQPQFGFCGYPDCSITSAVPFDPCFGGLDDPDDIFCGYPPE